ncbi:ABC transporter permease [Gloeocapsa sp. PCC 73106]|uniref:ABC transporter permease n=1 Tax=Gloeocapsa sp. PCC 73106 TaxID=102232 RepID=UPI0002AC8E15|nr:ABC transporter permease [Gloeocapsa sp. PCC 73106]ELR97155.1 ABC-type dipeptide/oligopeptide/nickel transport system, permease component [Gloeocapsa sp. PCC 73106]
MYRYLLNRLFIALITLIIISLVIYLILSLAPGDPLGEFATNPSITPEIRENIRKSLGLDQPIHLRYYKWLSAFLQGNLGYSFISLTPVSNLILDRLPTTIWIVGTAYCLALIIALPLGVIAALKRSSWLDSLINLIAFIGLSLPTFFTGLILIIIFSVQLKWLPFIYQSTLQVKDLTSFMNQIKQSIMPITVLALYQAAILIRFIRTAVLEEINQEYVRTAYAKGLSQFAVLVKHILRNALIPIVTLIALELPGIFTGALVTEQVFRVPGIGALLIDSINRSDTPVVMGITFISAILIVSFNLVADLIYLLVDPRVKYNKF